MGIVLSKDLKADLIHVSKRSDRVMRIKLGIEGTAINIICAYAPQSRLYRGGKYVLGTDGSRAECDTGWRKSDCRRITKLAHREE